MFISLLLLGFSFSKESGINDTSDMYAENSEEFKVVYANNQRLGTASNNSTDIRIVNKSNKEQSYYLYLEEINGMKYNDVTYRVNASSEYNLKNGIIKLGTLKEYGQEGDTGRFTVTLKSGNSTNLTFKIEVKTVNKNDLGNRILDSENVYKDSEQVVRYYGENPNNYIKYNNEFYRIICVKQDKVKILSEAVNLGVYSPIHDNYVTVEDYLGSFTNKEKVSQTSVAGMTGWMIDGKDFWLLDTVGLNAYYASMDEGLNMNSKLANYYIRTVLELDSTIEVVNGNGTIESPYEVAYGSK